MTRLLLVVAALAVLAAPASAASRNAIMDDCADDSRLQGDYTLAELRDARQNLRSEVAEYTDCADVLRRAELKLMAARGGREDRGGAPAGGSAEPPAPGAGAPPSDAEYAMLRRARSSGAAAVTVHPGAPAIRPGSAGFTSGAVRNEMPWSLIAVVAGLAILLAGGLGAAVRSAARRFAHAEGTGRP